MLGYVGDAVSGGGLSGVEVELRQGVGACDGTVLSRTTTDSSGAYQFLHVLEGSYTVTVSRTGYIQVCSNVSVNASNPNGAGNTNVVTTQTLPNNATRFVLVWGTAPRDLDSHLTGPTANGGRFHVYYNERNYTDAGSSVNLDRDDTDGQGPETITNTVYGTLPGVYRYAVHDYTNLSSTSSTALSNSGAAVLVFRGDRLLTTIRPNANTPGTVWRALEMDGTTGQINVVNSMAFESNPAFVIQGFGGAGWSEFTTLLRGLPGKR